MPGKFHSFRRKVVQVIGQHPLKTCFPTTMPSSNPADQQQACGCATDSPIYARMWPLIFFLSALTDFPMPPPKGKKQGQHRDWGFLPVFVVLGIIAISTYSYIARVCLVLLNVGQRSLAIGYLVPFCFFLSMCLFAYARIVIRRPGSPNKRPKRTKSLPSGVGPGVTGTTTSSGNFASSARLERQPSFPIQALLNVAEIDNQHTDDTNSDIKPPTENEDLPEVQDEENVSATKKDENEPNDEKAAAVVIPMKEDKTPEAPRPPIDFESILPQTKWCKTCQCWKPDRTHHCSICDECVLKMDHHCPWVNGCVGYNNYKFFLQFLCYTTLSGMWMLITTAVAYARYGRSQTFDGYAIVAMVISAIISFLVGAFTCAHLGLVTLGRTTIENKIYHAWDLTRPQHDQRFKFKRSDSQKLPAEKSEENRERDMEEGRVEMEDKAVEEKEKAIEKTDKTEKPVRLPETFTLTGKNLYNNGAWYNWRDVMGPNVLLWFIPIANSPGDGREFRYNATALEEYKQEERYQKKKQEA
ncbi:DHHC palmitoyltransferase-domain-containing protein [Umbelopsis sp. AD052]|nr:DHHC palmitoyltransferase-domain-containing protein [Umbelopsis sp. AD052]